MSSSAIAKSVVQHPSALLDKRVNILLVISSTYSNLQGDPDENNQPRVDPETQHGFMTPQGLTRKMRDINTQQGREIHIARKAVLSRAIVEESGKLGFDISDDGDDDEDEGAEAADDETKTSPKGTKVKVKSAKKGQKLSPEAKEQVIKAMAKRYIDFRTFGGVLTTINEGIAGPCQVSFAVSVDPVQVLDVAVTRCAVANEAEHEKSKDRTMGRLSVTPFGLYRQELTFTPYEAQKTGYTWGDYQQFMLDLQRCFDITKSKSRSQVVLEKMVVFTHSSALGDAPSHKLFRRVKITRTSASEESEKPARSIADYNIEIDRSNLPEGLTIDIIE